MIPVRRENADINCNAVVWASQGTRGIYYLCVSEGKDQSCDQQVQRRWARSTAEIISYNLKTFNHPSLRARTFFNWATRMRHRRDTVTQSCKFRCQREFARTLPGKIPDLKDFCYFENGLVSAQSALEVTDCPFCHSIYGQRALRLGRKSTVGWTRIPDLQYGRKRSG